MKEFFVEPLAKCTVADVDAIRARIDMSPPYQRQADLWSEAKQQLFIDSLLNGFDIPKLYFHEVASKGFKFAVVDGKQRLQTIWDFLDDKLELADDFEWFEDPKLVTSAHRTYSSLPPKVASRLDKYKLPIQIISTTDDFWVEELFCRLNEAMALNAPEKRNALGGPLPAVIRDVPKHKFFLDRIPFPNSRYKHLDLATKFLYFEHVGGAAETKRKTLDQFVLEYKQQGWTQKAADLKKKVIPVLDRLYGVFGEEDVLLSSLGLVVVYYLMERNKTLSNEPECRDILANFDKLRRQIRTLMRATPQNVKLDSELVEFERLSQSPNDVMAMTMRMSIIKKYIDDPKLIDSKLKGLK